MPWADRIVSENVRETVISAESVAVTNTENVPAAVGVPEIVPAGEMESPAGRPVADQDKGPMQLVVTSISE